MQVYKQKTRWKYLLLLGGFLIVLVTLWYNQSLSSRIAKDERNKVKIWAEAVEGKARLIQYTNRLFDRIAKEERSKVEMWANATARLVQATDEIDYFALEVVTNNETVPVILLNENNEVISYRNLEFDTLKKGTHLSRFKLRKFTTYEPILVSFEGQDNRIYYKDSRIFSELRTVVDDLINSFISEVVVNSASVPVVFTDEEKNILAFGNVDSTRVVEMQDQQQLLEEMEKENPPMQIDLGDEEIRYIYYKDSYLLKEIRYYPYIQLAIIGAFLLLAYYAFSSARKGEQNLVWVGMAKETAHQLGTPISSLLAWLEVLKEGGWKKELGEDMEIDVLRLQLIAERFSKIGSSPDLLSTDLVDHLKEQIQYLEKRKSKKVQFRLLAPENPVWVEISKPLFNWVIENLVNNAIDAMEGSGKLGIQLKTQGNNASIDLSDNGKGIAKNKFKTIFQPGYSTKKRGWGLGLSLTKRIVENYHNGKIYVLRSSPGKGTTFRIILPFSTKKLA